MTVAFSEAKAAARPPARRLYWFLRVLSGLILGSVLCATVAGAAMPPGGALAGERFRVLISTDIGGSDPDDFQSMVHYLMYADLFDTEGLISSPPHAGRKAHILEVLDAYATDYPKLKARSARFPAPEALRAMVKQGATDPAPPSGFSTPTEGSRWIIERARANDPRPLWILVWGCLTDVAQALHDEPAIKPKLRVYFISSWNRRQDPAARDYLIRQHPDLWLIEADSTFRGMYVGGPQEADLGNREFVARHVKGHGALGDLLAAKKADIKMGDTPSVLYLLRGPAEDPAAEHWGGAFMRPRPGVNYWTDHPDPALREGSYAGAKTVNRWREDCLRDWQTRLAWLEASPSTPRAGNLSVRTAATNAAPPPAPDIARLIQQAGDTEAEMERLRLLRQLASRKDLSPALRGDLEKLLPVVEDWADCKSRVVVDTGRAAENGYLCRFITSRVRPATDGPLHPPALSENSPLRPLWAFYRGRMLIWQVIQSGPLLRVRESREKYYNEGRQLLAETRAAHPSNRVVRMYLGEPIPWPKVFAADPAAPAWANLQREGLEKLADVIHWWIAERQLPDGQFGGGWGDDVEMWRWWTPVLIGFEDPVVNAAQARLSHGIFQQPHLREGFTSRLTDVEHSNEDTTDTILPMMHLQPDDPVWKKRALRLAELMRDRWTGRNQRGLLQFKSIYFSVDRVDTNAARAFDTVYHPAIVQPALLYWQRTGDPELTALFSEWLKVWVDAAARAENGKPAGVLPSAIRWPDGGIARVGQPWWEPFSPGHNDALYNWPGATRLMTSTLLLAYHMTGNEHFLQPIHSMAALRLKHLSASATPAPGTEAWCAQNMRGFLPDTLAKYRLLTGDTRYDKLLRADASGYVRFRLTGERAALESHLLRNAEAFRANWEAYTSEMRWTDRVIAFTGNYLNYLPEPAPPAPNPQILYSSVTGDPGNPLVFPLNVVRWRTPPREFAALVTESGRKVFAAEVYHFGHKPRELNAELFLLEPGQYELTVAPVGGNEAAPLHTSAVQVSGPRTQVPLRLPPRQLCRVRLAAR